MGLQAYTIRVSLTKMSSTSVSRPKHCVLGVTTEETKCSAWTTPDGHRARLRQDFTRPGALSPGQDSAWSEGSRSSGASHLYRKDPRQDGAGDAYFCAGLHKTEEGVGLKEELGDDEVSTCGYFLLQVLQVLLKALCLGVAFGVTYR